MWRPVVCDRFSADIGDNKCLATSRRSIRNYVKGYSCCRVTKLKYRRIGKVEATMTLIDVLMHLQSQIGHEPAVCSLDNSITLFSAVYTDLYVLGYDATIHAVHKFEPHL
jgi:hypothetical protein